MAQETFQTVKEAPRMPKSAPRRTMMASTAAQEVPDTSKEGSSKSTLKRL